MNEQTASTVEPQYEDHVQLKKKFGLRKLGVEKNGCWHIDPRRVVFVLSRYKFVSKMFSGKSRVLELGCGDGFAIPIILQEVGSVHAVDIDPCFIEDIRERIDPKWPFTFEVHDVLSGPIQHEPFDAAYSLDVLEHISPSKERIFLQNTVDSLVAQGELIIGMPSLESQTYASAGSKIGHINCKSAPALKSLLQEYFHTVFIFSMNDEVVHTGFHPMAQYIFGLCANKK